MAPQFPPRRFLKRLIAGYQAVINEGQLNSREVGFSESGSVPPNGGGS